MRAANAGCASCLEERQDGERTLPASPSGAGGGGGPSASSGDGNAAESAGTRVVLLVRLPTVLLLKERGAASPAKMNCEGREGIDPPSSFPVLCSACASPGFSLGRKRAGLMGMQHGEGGAYGFWVLLQHHQGLSKILFHHFKQWQGKAGFPRSWLVVPLLLRRAPAILVVLSLGACLEPK